MRVKTLNRESFHRYISTEKGPRHHLPLGIRCVGPGLT